jgi:nitronate monooxygenase
MKAGVAGYSTLNYRTLENYALPLSNLETKVLGGSFGYNLIVNKSNIKYKDQLAVLCAEK